VHDDDDCDGGKVGCVGEGVGMVGFAVGLSVGNEQVVVGSPFLFEHGACKG